MLVSLPTPTWKEGSSYMFAQPLVHLEREIQSGKVEDWNLAMHMICSISHYHTRENMRHDIFGSHPLPRRSSTLSVILALSQSSLQKQHHSYGGEIPTANVVVIA